MYLLLSYTPCRNIYPEGGTQSLFLDYIGVLLLLTFNPRFPNSNVRDRYLLLLDET